MASSRILGMRKVAQTYIETLNMLGCMIFPTGLLAMYVRVVHVGLALMYTVTVDQTTTL